MKTTIKIYKANDGHYVSGQGIYDYVGPKQNLLKWLSGKEQKVVDGKTLVKVDDVIDQVPEGPVLDSLKRLGT